MFALIPGAVPTLGLLGVVVVILVVPVVLLGLLAGLLLLPPIAIWRLATHARSGVHGHHP